MNPVLILTGPERGLRKRFISSILKNFKDEQKTDLDIIRMHGGEDSVDEAISKLRNESLFGNATVVFFTMMEMVKTVPEIKMLMDYIERPNKNALLILSSDQVNGVDKRIQAIVPKEGQKIFWEMFESEKQGWIQQYVRSKNASITVDAIELFLSMVSNESLEMASELQKLILMKGAKQEEEVEIVLSDVEEFIYHSKEETVFSLFEEIAQRNLEKSLDILMKLSDSGENLISILSGLAWQIRKVQDLASLVSVEQPERAMESLGIRGKRSQSLYRRALSNYSLEDLTEWVDLTGRMEMEMRKVGSHLQLHILYLFVHSLIYSKGRSFLFKRRFRSLFEV